MTLHVLRPPAPLSAESIDWLFSTLSVRYGTPFTDRWRDLDLNIVKSDWARELGQFAGNAAAIKFALKHLPEKPPTVIDFKRLCNAMPTEFAALVDDPTLRGPTAEECEKLRELRDSFTKPNIPSREWAYRLIAAHESGDFKTPVAVAMARAAIGKDQLGEGQEQAA